MAGLGLMGRLPTFPQATLDEIVDIRSALSPAVTRFRSALVSVSNGFSSKPWEQGFEDELQDAWVEVVAPALEEIDAAVGENRSLLNLTRLYVDAAKTAWPGLAVLATGIFAHQPIATFASGALTAVTPALKAAWERRTVERAIELRPFYFLYRLGSTSWN